MTATKIHPKSYLPIVIIVLSFLFMYLIGSKIPESTIRKIIMNAGPYGVVLFIFLTWLTNIIAPLSATPFMFAGFYMYGRTVIFYVVDPL